MTNSKEKQFIKELIQLYRDSRCLWDTRDVSYTNKPARDKAYKALLEKFKSFYEEGTLNEVKKKIENFRTTYRKECKKVLQDDEYVPKLWYYEDMQFLNDILVWPEGNTMVIYKDRSRSTSPPTKPAKKRKSSERDDSSLRAVYLPELDDNLEKSDQDDNYEDDDCSQDKKTHFTAQVEEINEFGKSGRSSRPITEPEAFGQAITLQLQELDPVQKHIAEKLISDVIFNGRFKRLTIDSCITKLKSVDGLND